jgi:uncharacterized protein YjbI with pentapeptide repeats
VNLTNALADAANFSTGNFSFANITGIDWKGANTGSADFYGAVTQ